MAEKFQDIIEKIEKLTAIELAELVKALEEKFGVSAAAMAVAAPAPAGAVAVGGGTAEAKSVYSVVIIEPGQQKIAVIKVVREATGLGLKESKDLVDAAPKEVRGNLSKEDAEELKRKLENAGAVVELR